jgi:hypothetical protein
MNVPYITIYKHLKRAHIPAETVAQAASAIFILSQVHCMNAAQEANNFIASYQDNPATALGALLMQVERMESRKVKS